MIKHKKIIIKINAVFGSEFQKASAFEALVSMLRAWASFYEISHKNNIIKFKIVEEDEP